MIKTIIIAEPGKQEVIMSAVINAPREVVFRVYVEPKLIEQWWMAKELKVTVDKMEVKFGGIWRHVMHTPDNKAFVFQGVYHTIKPPEMIITTFEFNYTPVQLEIIALEDQNGKTKLTNKVIFQSVEERDKTLPGMQKEAPNVMNRIAAVVANLIK